jgi:ribose transport system substrate-binding protein
MARKTWIVAACLAILAFGVAACGSDDDGGGSSSSSTSSSSSGKKNYKMTLIAGVKGDEFYITMNCGAQAKAKELGVTLDFQGPDKFDASLQTPVVNAVAAKKPDAVLVAPTDTKAMFAPIKQLADGGAKVALVDTTLEQSDLAVSQIASDNEGGGKQAAKTLGELIGGKGKVFVVNVKPGISTTDARGKGFEDGAKAAGLTYLGQQFDDDDPAKAASIVKAVLAKNPDLKGGRGQRYPRGRQAGEGEDRRLRRRPQASGRPQEGHRPGPHRPEAGRDRRGRRAAGLQRADRQADDEEDRHRVRVGDQGQPRPEPGLALQGELLS